MPLNADTLLDRFHLKSQITKWRLAAIAFALIAVVAFVERNSTRSPVAGDYIARLTFDGMIGDDQKIYALIEEIEKDNKAKAVIVWLDTPGGSAVGGEEIYLRLRELSAKKPVVAVMRSLAASAGYMIALGADHIIARDGTITGSIGVLVELAEVTELADKIGIKPIIIKSAPLKGTPSLFEKSTPESERVLKDVIDDFYARFVDMVTERRGLPRERVLQLADGRVYSGRQAFKNKLIDGIGGEAEAVKWLETERKIKPGLEIDDVEVKQEISVFDKLTQSTIGRFLPKQQVGLDGLAAVWHPELQ